MLSLSCTPLLTLLFCIKCFGLPLGVGALVILTYITFLFGLFQASSVSSCCGNRSGLCRRCRLWGTGSASRWSSSSQGQWLSSFLFFLLCIVSSLNALMTDTCSACWVILGVSMIYRSLTVTQTAGSSACIYILYIFLQWYWVLQ